MFACLYVPPLAGRPTTSDFGLGAPNAAAALGIRTSDDGTRPWDMERAASGDLASLAREFSPRVEMHRPGLVTLDVRGLERLFGDASGLGDELRRAAADRGLPARIAIASTRTAAWLLAHARAGLTIVPAGDEQRWLSPLPLHVLEQLAANGLGPGVGGVPPLKDEVRGSGVGRGAPTSDRAWRGAGVPAIQEKTGVGRGAPTSDRAWRGAGVPAIQTLKRWGLRTLGDFTRLPPLELSERLGQQGLAWQQVARGEDMVPLVPDAPEERFEETLDLEWPIEGLQPLSFVFGRLFDALSARLVERDRAAAVLHIHLQLVTREVECRSLQLPAPMRDARVLRTLALLNLEAHPVTAGIDRVTVAVDPVPGRVIQCSLLTRALPLPEQMSTLVARLGAVMGDGRCGMAALVDSYRPGAFEMKPFSVEWHKALVATGLKAGGPTALNTGAPTGHVGREFSPANHVAQDINPTWDRRPSGRWQQDHPGLAIRRFRLPIPASVAVKDGRPVRVATERQGLRGGCVDACAGPWRTSGQWWHVSDARVQADGEGSRPQVGWNRDEWDVNLADGGVYRIYRDRDRDRWFIDGVID
jgi:protein ImuB